MAPSVRTRGARGRSGRAWSDAVRTGLDCAGGPVAGGLGERLVHGRRSRLTSNDRTTRITPTATAQIPTTVTMAARVAPGLASASTPSGTSSRPRISSNHQSGRTLRAAKAPEIVMVPITISHDPRKIATATIPGAGQMMIATPTAIERSPVMTLARRTRSSIPEVQRRSDALENEQGSEECGEAAEAPVDAEDEHARHDQQQAVQQEHPPVAGHALGGLAGNRVGEVARGNKH